MTGNGFNGGVPKLPPLSAFSPYDPAAKDTAYIPGQSKNMGLGSGLYDYQALPGQQHMLTNQLMQDSDLLNNFSKMKPYDMPYQGMSGLMGQNMTMYNSKMHRKDSYDHQE